MCVSVSVFFACLLLRSLFALGNAMLGQNVHNNQDMYIYYTRRIDKEVLDHVCPVVTDVRHKKSKEF